jgi:hypothetical protein
MKKKTILSKYCKRNLLVDVKKRARKSHFFHGILDVGMNVAAHGGSYTPLQCPCPSGQT